MPENRRGRPPQETGGFERLHERLDRQDKVLADIREQTTRTNGRVSALETWRTAEEAKASTLWQNITQTGKVIGFILTLAVALGGLVIALLK